MPHYYPFLNSERERLKSLGLQLDKIQQDPFYAQAIENAALDVIGKSKEPQDRDLAIVEFTLAKIFLSVIDNPTAAEAYAERKSEDFRQALEKESLTFLIKVAREDFGMDVKTEESLRVQFIDFLRYKPEFLKLSQMNMLKGYVQLTKSQLPWVLKGAIKRRILGSIPKNTKFPDGIEAAAKKLRGKITQPRRYSERPRISKLQETALPPCIKGIISALEGGTSNHNANFVLVTFFHGLGLDEKSILEVFRRSPKFKERIAAYQIKFSKERGYTCPSCESIKGYGICKWQCPRKSPISNYFLNARRK